LELHLAAAADSLGLIWNLCEGLGSDRETSTSHFSSTWFVIARTAAAPDHLRSDGTLNWTLPPSSGRSLWTDEGKHDLNAIRRKL